MPTLTLREGLGRPLTYQEMDDNLRFVEVRAQEAGSSAESAGLAAQFAEADRQHVDQQRQAVDAAAAAVDQAIDNAGYVGTGPNGEVEDYAEGIEITARNQVIRADGELWRISASVDLPYATSGDWAADSGDFVAVGDAALRQELVQPVATFNNVQDMKDASGLDVGRKVRTLGYYTPGDGGGNEYEIVAAGTGVDDGGSFIDLASGLQARGVFPDGVWVEQFGVKKGSTVDAQNNASAIQSAYDYLDTFTNSGKLNAGIGDIYYTPDKSITVVRGHVLSGASPGALPNNVVYEDSLSDPATRFILYGDGSSKKFVRTRREYRGSSSDPQDAPLSVGFDLQGIGAGFENLRHELFCDYSDSSQSNLGDNWDVIVLASRMGYYSKNVHFRGYPRYKHLLLDATRGVGLPEFDSAFPTDTHAKGIDGIHIEGFRSVGTSGIGLLGPKPKPGLLHPGFQYKTACQVYLNTANASDGDTVTIGGETFTFRTSKQWPGEVQIGASATESLENLRLEWLEDKEAPYEDLTLRVNGQALEIYSLSSSSTPVSENGAQLFVNQLGTQLAATGTVAISDPAPYYDEILGQAVDDGRNSLGASDFVLDDYVISVAHHSGYRMTDIRSDKNPDLEPDTTHACLHIDGMGGRIFIHKWFIGAGRFESVEPFTVRLGLTGRGFLALGSTFDSNVTAWLSTTGGALTTNDQYGKVSGEKYKTCRVGVYTHDDPGNYFYHNRDGNRVDTNFRKLVNLLVTQREASIGRHLVVGAKNTGSDTGFVNIRAGRNANSQILFSGEDQDTKSRIRSGPGGGITFSTRNGATGSLSNVAFASTSGFSFFSTPRPASDNTLQLGDAALRWSEVYAANGTINTSDEREKQQARLLEQSEIAVAQKLKGLIRAFKWNHAVEQKGDSARWHFGVMAQEVAVAFESEGLDPHEYGLFCYDQWDDQYDANGNLVVVAGDRYGVRYDQLMAFVISVL